MFETTSLPITIACPIRGRSDLFPYYITSIYLDLHGTVSLGLVKIRILVNYDNTLEEREEAQKVYDYSRLAVEKFGIDIEVKFVHNLDIIKDTRSAPRLEIYSHLGELRNELKRNCNSNFLMYLDSDIMLTQKDSISKLIIDARAYGLKSGISLLIDNGHNATNAMAYDENIKKYTHLKYTPNTGIRFCDLTGAGFLLPFQVYQKHDFGFSIIGEDEPFCRSMRMANIPIYQDTSIIATHCMNEKQFEEFKYRNPYITKLVREVFFNRSQYEDED